jgi:hypothetical protein
VYRHWIAKRSRPGSGPLLRCFQTFDLLGNWKAKGAVPVTLLSSGDEGRRQYKALQHIRAVLFHPSARARPLQS